MAKAITKSNASAKSAAAKLTDLQTSLLSVATQREDRCLERTPSLRGAQIAKVGETLIAAGYAREVKARASAPVWRTDGESGVSFALKLTAAGAKAIAAAQSSAGVVIGNSKEAASATEKSASPDSAGTASRAAKPLPPPTSAVRDPRPASKIAAVIGLLSRAEGASLADLITATGWLPHSVRAALTGLRKRGYTLSLERTDPHRGSVYQLTPQPNARDDKPQERAAEAA